MFTQNSTWKEGSLREQRSRILGIDDGRFFALGRSPAFIVLVLILDADRNVASPRLVLRFMLARVLQLNPSRYSRTRSDSSTGTGLRPAETVGYPRQFDQPIL